MMNIQFNLDNKIVVVTGASKGIGAGISKELAIAGAIVMLCARNTEQLNELKNEIEKENGVAYVFQLDVSSVNQINEVFKLIYDQFGRIDILINNAGLGYNHAASDVTEADWDEMMNVNLKGLFFCSQQAGKYMIKNEYGRIINMSSQASLVAIKDHSVYCASKGGVNLLTKVLALEWAEKGITVNGIAPTFTYTAGTAERLDNPEYLASVLNRIPVGKVATIKDIVSAILYLTSTHSSMVTGSTLVIDGGWTIQ
jgi:2-deoxy-D-gluconate 3-dehydrogenase